MTSQVEAVGLGDDDRRRLAANLYNYVWALLDRPDRSTPDDEAMINAAHSSRFFWGTLDDPVNLTRGEWQISRVYVTLGHREESLAHARAALDLCLANEIIGFDLGFAHEAVARAHALAGDIDVANQHRSQAEQIARQLEDVDDRELLLSDLATLPLER